MSVESDVEASLMLASQAGAKKSPSLLDLVAPTEIASLLPSFANGKAMLIWLIANPGVFLTLSKSVPVVADSTLSYSDRLENGLIPIERVVASALDKQSEGVSDSVSILSELSEEKLCDELISRSLAIPHVQSFGVQGNSGVQINRGQVIGVIGTLFKEALPYILPLLLSKFK